MMGRLERDFTIRQNGWSVMSAMGARVISGVVCCVQENIISTSLADKSHQINVLLSCRT
jgi:hypothetical protein